MDIHATEGKMLGQCVMKNGIPLDNRYVVPYNPYLSVKYNAHINVEICNSIKSCKYLYKYVYNGPDMASVSTQIVDQQNSHEEQESTNKRNIDEIKKNCQLKISYCYRMLLEDIFL